MSNQLNPSMISQVSRDVRQLSQRAGSYLQVWSDRTLWMSRKCSVRQLVMIQELVKHRLLRRSVSALFLVSVPDAKRPSRLSPCWRSAIRCPTPRVVSCLMEATVSRSREICTDSRPARGQRGGRRVQRRKRAAAHAKICKSGFWTTTPLLRTWRSG